MALRIHNLPSARIKKRLLWIRWRDVSRCWKPMRTHFQHLGHRKKSGLDKVGCDVLSRWMALRT
jgi:hypothetical protein